MLGAVALFSAMDALMKLLAEHYPPMQVTALRGLASLPFLLLPIAVRGRWPRLRTTRWHWHIGRAAIGVIMLWTFIYAVQRLSLADTYSIFMCAPLLIAALSTPLLRERVAIGQWAAIAVGLAGVVVMLRPTGSSWATLGGLAAVLSAVCYAVSAILLRVMSRSETTESLVVYFTALLSFGAGLLALSGWRPMTMGDLPLVLGIGVCGSVAQHLITRAFTDAPASVVAPFEYTALLWGVLLDLAIWKVLPGAVTLAGGAVVIGAGLYLIVRERRTPEVAAVDHP
ncbi:MAG: DMT family transporter [Gemmatimonadetes bacterium]|nr:DMT family transporter [Gemmatimonadota bacterium]